MGDIGTIESGRRARPVISIPTMGLFALNLTLWVPLPLSWCSPSPGFLMVSLLPLSLLPSPWPFAFALALFLQYTAWPLGPDSGIGGFWELPMLNRLPTYLAFGS